MISSKPAFYRDPAYEVLKFQDGSSAILDENVPLFYDLLEQEPLSRLVAQEGYDVFVRELSKAPSHVRKGITKLAKKGDVAFQSQDQYLGPERSKIEVSVGLPASKGKNFVVERFLKRVSDKTAFAVARSLNFHLN